MKPDHATRAEAGSANRPLTKPQRIRLARTAREAYAKLEPLDLVDGLPFDAWRHQQTIKACGLRITEAANRDYLPILTHFLDLAGRHDAAFNASLAQQTQDHAWAMKKLYDACQAEKVTLDYPRAIARNKYKTTDLDALSPRQLWHLTFSVRRNAQRKRGRACGDIARQALGIINARHTSTGVNA